MTSWDETREKIKHAYNKIESAYEKHVASGADKVKERPLLNTAVKLSLSAIPIIGPNLRDLYDNIGGRTKPEEEKAKQILEFLKKLEQQNKEQFNVVAKNLKTNFDAIDNAISENRITVTDLISHSSAEILSEISSIKEDARAIRAILEKKRPSPRELKRFPKPSRFRGESRIFVGRKQDIDTIRNYFAESNQPVSITGEGGIGKSELAYNAMHKCEDMFDLIIPIYFESGSVMTFDSFLFEMAKSLDLPIDEFEKNKLSLEEYRDIIMDTFGQQFKRPLIYIDNYEIISRLLRIKQIPLPSCSQKGEDDARKINAFLESSLPANTALLLTSRERHNLDGERPVRLDGLSESEGRDLFIELAKNYFSSAGEASEEIKRALELVSRKSGGHPLSIELLARSYRGGGLTKISEMLNHMGIGVINPKEETERLQSLQSCFEYSFSRLSLTQRDLLTKLVLFNSPFPGDVLKEIFRSNDSEVLLELYDRSLLRRIEFSDYIHDNNDHGEGANYHLYYFHPAIKNYLEHQLVAVAHKLQDIEERYAEQFILYYYNLVLETYKALGTKDHGVSLERFSVIIQQGKDNDFERAIKLAKDRSVASNIASTLGLVLDNLGMYDEALKFHYTSLTIDEELQDIVRMDRDYANIGSVLYRQGNYDLALSYHKKALAIDEALQDKVGMARDYANIGLLFKDRRKYRQALEYQDKALAIHEKLQDKVGMARDYANIGLVLGNPSLENPEAAIESFDKGEEMFEEFEEKTGYRHPSSDIIHRYFSGLGRKDVIALILLIIFSVIVFLGRALTWFYD